MGNKIKGIEILRSQSSLDDPKIREKFKSNFGKNILFDEVLAQYTSFKIGGKADLLFSPTEIDVLRKFMIMIREHNIPFVVLGGGTNILISDSGFMGAVINMRNIKGILLNSDNIVNTRAGVELMKLVNYAAERGLTGLEFAAGIPGTVGGALKCNAGGKYGCMADIVEYAECINGTGHPGFFDGFFHFLKNGDTVGIILKPPNGQQNYLFDSGNKSHFISLLYMYTFVGEISFKKNWEQYPHLPYFFANGLQP